MPIKPNRKKLYPHNWKEISRRIKERAGWRCEWCGAEHGKPHPETGSIVILTVHHIDGNPSNNSPDNLVALCQRCHLRADAQLHAQHARITRLRKKEETLRKAGQLKLFKKEGREMKVKVGDRVGAINGLVEKDGKKVLEIFGFGTYIGEKVPEDDNVKFFGISLKEIGRANPCILLDNGKKVYGCECWWGPEEKVKKAIEEWIKAGEVDEVVTVDIEQLRKEREEK